MLGVFSSPPNILSFNHDTPLRPAAAAKPTGPADITAVLPSFDSGIIEERNPFFSSEAVLVPLSGANSPELVFSNVDLPFASAGAGAPDASISFLNFFIASA